jgi:capsular polysaccharide transport system ATP-binding protein
MRLLDCANLAAQHLGASDVTAPSGTADALVQVDQAGQPAWTASRQPAQRAAKDLIAPEVRSIQLRNVVKEYHTNIGVRRVLDGISFEIKGGEKIAVLGKNGAGKSTLVKIIGGVEQPTSGEINRQLFLSWPIAFSGGFEATMSGIDNIRFIARVYGVPMEDAIGFVDDFAELGRQLYLPVSTYSSGMRARLAFGLTLAVDFECFLIDEVIAVGDARFHQKCFDALFVKRKHCAMILISHDLHIIRQYCNKALVLKNGRGRVFDDLELACSIYGSL